MFGNKLRQSTGRVTNGLNFSYPGYNEVLCGFADPQVRSNGKIYNRNSTVLEWLHSKPEFHGKIAAFTSWEVFPFIINDKRSGIPVNAGYMPLTGVPDAPEVQLFNKLMTETALLGEETRFDAFTFRAGLLYLKARKPRVMFLSFDETDAQGHAGRYDRLLACATKNDNFVRELWDTVQQMPEYKDKTTLIVTTDHGRGDPPVDWKNHGEKTKGLGVFLGRLFGPRHAGPWGNAGRRADQSNADRRHPGGSVGLRLHWSRAESRAGYTWGGGCRPVIGASPGTLPRR